MTANPCPPLRRRAFLAQAAALSTLPFAKAQAAAPCPPKMPATTAHTVVAFFIPKHGPAAEAALHDITL